MLTLISATPSPFARINRIAMTLKSIPFTIQNEIPWHDDTKTPSWNPLEKLPILVFDDGRPPIYDSAHIQEYIVQKYSDHEPKLLTGDLDLDMRCRQIQVLAEGLMDAFVLVFWETQRDVQSETWLSRQNRKVDGAMKACDELVRNWEDGDVFLVGGCLTIADIAVVCAIDQVDFGGIRPGWKDMYPRLAEWVADMDERECFKDTKPVMFDLKDKVV